jgi:hypothetical protein
MWPQGRVQRWAKVCLAVAVACGSAGTAEAAVTRSGGNLNIVGNTTSAETFTIVGSGVGNVTVTSSAGVQPFTGIVNVNIDGGGGPETINITSLNINGNLNALLRAGGSTVRVQGTTIIRGKTTVVGTTGADSVRFLGADLVGDVSINTGAGAGTIELDDVLAFANVLLQCGDNGLDRILIENETVIFGNLAINTGNGTSDVDLAMSGARGNILINGGLNRDVVTFSDIAGANGSISIYTFEGNDLVEFFEGSGCGNNLQISTGAGEDDVSLLGGETSEEQEADGVFIGRNLLIDTSTEADFIEAQFLFVQGNTHVNTGDQGDELSADTCVFLGNLTLLMFGGEDLADAFDVFVELNTLVRLGTENDTATVNLSHFDGTVEFDGGLGTDTVTEAGNLYHGGLPTITNVP